MRITASQINEWANRYTKEAQTELPRWVRKLCFQAGVTREIAFPAGDSTFRPGWDGTLFSDQGNAWVPSGASCWEIGCDFNVSSKVNREFHKRTEATDSSERNRTTFVFVTPRRWLQKNVWIAAQKKNSKWADIKVWDADDLEQWIEQSPAIALQFAEFLGLHGPGVESLERYWLRWSGQCNPAITKDAFFTDRAGTRERLQELAKETGGDRGGAVTLCADSAEEAVAFAAASFLEHQELADQALVVEDIDGWRYVEANPLLRIVIVAREEIAAYSAPQNGLLLVVPHASGDMTEKRFSKELLLERPSIYDFQKALVAIGMEEADARRFALSTGRSWSILRRRCAIFHAIQYPVWLDMPQAVSLISVCLLGAWDGGKEADRRAVECIANQSYEAVEENLLHLTQVDDAPILRIGRVWKAKSPLELLDLFGSRMTGSQLDRFFQLVTELLGTPDPQLELPDPERYMAQIHGKVHPQSGLLFESLCDTLIKLAVRGPGIPNLRNLNIESRVAELIIDLLGNANTNRWLSLASYLPALAEAAPDAFLNAIESSLDHPDAPVTQLILETRDSSFVGRCWHSGLLWALETLAWAPKRLARVALLLTRLTHVPYNSRWGNTPSSSLLGLFRSWLPQTAAELPTRQKVLGLLVQGYPDAAFDLLDAITERGPQHAHPSVRPTWRDDDVGAGKGVPRHEERDMYLAAREHMYRLSVGHAPRLVRLFENTGVKDSEEMVRVLHLMHSFTLDGAADNDRVALRATLRNRLHWYRNYSDEPDSTLEETLTILESIYRDLAPTDPILRHIWLFSSPWPELPIRDSGNNASKGCLVSEARFEALDDIIHAMGMAGIQRLIVESCNPETVGQALAMREENIDEWPQWIIDHGEDFQLDSPASRCIGGLLRHLSNQHISAILREVLEYGPGKNWEPAQQARLLALAPAVKSTWEFAASIGADTDFAYWRCVPIQNWILDWRDNSAYVLQRLFDVQRPRTALECCRLCLEQTDSRILIDILYSFLQGDEPEGPQPKSWTIRKVIDRLEQSEDIEKTSLVQLEFLLFPILEYAGEAHANALFEAVTSDPAMFSEIVSLAYKPENGESEAPISDALRNAASIAGSILRTCRRQPGTCADGNIDAGEFIHFVEVAREHCRQKNRVRKGEFALGTILAHAPVDGDGTWPIAPVREVLDRPEMDEMRRGFFIGVRNMRGITSRDLLEGGDQERNLASFYQNQSEKIQHVHLRLAELMESLARSYENDAIQEDNEANLRKEGF